MKIVRVKIFSSSRVANENFQQQINSKIKICYLTRKFSVYFVLYLVE